MRIGLDIGSTTLKAVVLDDDDKIVYSSYARHFSEINTKAAELLEYIKENTVRADEASLTISGSAGMGVSQSCDIPFIQEVYATRIAVKRLAPNASVIIELGGEDAKILFMTGGMEVRMNGSCAGGTGAFIDQMASLLKVDADELNELAKSAERKYTIASRCGVFAKSDIQPLINQGAHKEDISASILYAVVNQTIAGLAQGRKIEGEILYLGGPLTFLSELRLAFDKTLEAKGTCPKNSLYFVALGAAYSAEEKLSLSTIINRLREYKGDGGYSITQPLFASKAEYKSFCERHGKDRVPRRELLNKEKVYIGVDAGSTTVKMAVIGEDDALLFSHYRTNSGNPVSVVKKFLLELYEKYPDVVIAGGAVTGYGEAIIQNAFNFDCGLVETVAHFTAAKKFMPQVDFVIDIGGQDIKCFKIKNGVIDNIFLNEACSSGCGSFLQSFASTLNYKMEDFARLGIFADHPVELGSRCTVFMNSSVKQAQKDGASVENISAGLSMSVIKNALYKVIRVASKEELGKNIVVQGGTFYNDAVLRGFEKELECEVVRPDIAGLMGAYGAALFAKEQKAKKSDKPCKIADKEALLDFSAVEKNVNCGLCSNNCKLCISTFKNGNRYISGNKCERPLKHDGVDDMLNLYEYKRALLSNYFYKKNEVAFRGRIGIPMVLNNFELLPFWSNFFETLGFSVVTDGFSDRKLYLKGQNSIPSDTVCFPAKLVHGHIEKLLEMEIDAIFYPCMTYNLDEKKGDNHFNCPVVAYYPEVISANMELSGRPFIYDHIKPEKNNRFAAHIHAVLSKYFEGISKREVRLAVDNAFEAYNDFRARVSQQGKAIVGKAREEGKKIIVLAGRPYHIDPEISHSIDKLISSFGVAVVSEDAVSDEILPFETNVLNQWTYHARMYAAAKYIAGQEDMQLIQLVSFGCGVDAITADEVREILEENDKIYTQIKIDEITNLGAVKIRLRSLFAAVEQQERATRQGGGR